MNVAKLLTHPAIASVFTFVRERRYYVVAATCCGLVLVYVTRKRRISASTHAQIARDARETHALTQESTQSTLESSQSTQVVLVETKTDVLESIVVEKKEESLSVVVAQNDPIPVPQEETKETPEEKAKRKKAQLKQTVIDGVNLVMGKSAGDLVESIIEISKTAKKSGGLEAFVKSGKLGKLFKKDIIPFLKKKLQNKKFPTIIGTTDSPLGDLHYEISGITLESLDIDPSLQCDISDGNEALQIKVLISSALLKNISWKCGTSKIKEKGVANAEIAKAVCLFRISLDKSQVIPKLSIKHCSIDLEQFNLELKGGKASWVYNKLTSIFNNKIKTKLKEKIDKTLTKKCAQFESKINFAASKVLSLFGGDKDKKKNQQLTAAEAQPVPHKKCFLYANETHGEELECVLLDLRSFSDVTELRVAFFGEVGLPNLAQKTQTRVRFRDRSGTLISVSKSTTISQIIEHAEYVCFYRDSLSSSMSSNASLSRDSLSRDSLSRDSLSRDLSSSSSSSSFSSLNSSFNGLNSSYREESYYDMSSGMLDFTSNNY